MDERSEHSKNVGKVKSDGKRSCPDSLYQINKKIKYEVDEVEYHSSDFEHSYTPEEVSTDINVKNENDLYCNENFEICEYSLTSELDIKNEPFESENISDTSNSCNFMYNEYKSNQILNSESDEHLLNLQIEKDVQCNKILDETNPKCESQVNAVEISGNNMFTDTGCELQYYYCPFCNTGERDIKVIQKHIDNNHKDYQSETLINIQCKNISIVRCEICIHGNSFPGINKWLNHVRDSHRLKIIGTSLTYIELTRYSRFYICPICLQSFENSTQTNKHIKSKHPLETKLPQLKLNNTKLWSCKICFSKNIFKYFIKKEYIENHILVQHNETSNFELEFGKLTEIECTTDISGVVISSNNCEKIKQSSNSCVDTTRDQVISNTNTNQDKIEAKINGEVFESIDVNDKTMLESFYDIDDVSMWDDKELEKSLIPVIFAEKNVINCDTQANSNEKCNKESVIAGEKIHKELFICQVCNLSIGIKDTSNHIKTNHSKEKNFTYVKSDIFVWKCCLCYSDQCLYYKKSMGLALHIKKQHPTYYTSLFVMKRKNDLDIDTNNKKSDVAIMQEIVLKNYGTLYTECIFKCPECNLQYKGEEHIIEHLNTCHNTNVDLAMKNVSSDELEFWCCNLCEVPNDIGTSCYIKFKDLKDHIIENHFYNPKECHKNYSKIECKRKVVKFRPKCENSDMVQSNEMFSDDETVSTEHTHLTADSPIVQSEHPIAGVSGVIINVYGEDERGIQEISDDNKYLFEQVIDASEQCDRETVITQSKEFSGLNSDQSVVVISCNEDTCELAIEDDTC